MNLGIFIYNNGWNLKHQILVDLQLLKKYLIKDFKSLKIIQFKLKKNLLIQ